MSDLDLQKRLRANWSAVVDEVEKAALAADRDPNSINIVGVSKYVDRETTIALAQVGCSHLGESRPQHFWSKAEDWPDNLSVDWHIIGHLQRNKIRRTLKQRPLIHSVDSMRLLQAIADEAVSQQTTARVLLEVNISGDEAKTGLAPDELPGLLDNLPEAGIDVCGLMAMAGWGTDPSAARQQFEKTRRLRDELEKSTGRSLAELSMGMSGDFPAAIAEGATMVRVGSRLFEGIER